MAAMDCTRPTRFGWISHCLSIVVFRSRWADATTSAACSRAV